MVARNDENEEYEDRDQNKTNDRPDTEARVEDTTPDAGVDQTRPVGRREIHTLHREMNQGRQCEHDQ